MSDEDVFNDDALEQSERFENIASELFEVDRSGIFLQGFLSLMIASTASIGSYLATGLEPYTAVLIFVVTFLPNFGLKVVAEYIKKRALVKGMKQGYVEGRKDSALNKSAITEMARWARVYIALNSATLWRTDNL